MSDYADISTAMVVYRKPELKTITPKSGPNEGKEVPVLVLKCFHPNFAKNKKGEWEQKDSDFYTVQHYGEAAKHIHKHVQNGMTLEIRGQVTVRTFEGEDGKEHKENVVTTKMIALALNQLGLKSIDYERPEKKVERAEDFER